MSQTPRIISPDTRRDVRIPPNQYETGGWPVLHVGTVPKFDRARWTFRIFGLVEQEWLCTYDQFQALPRVQVHADMHCVTAWSKLDNLWEGVSTQEVLRSSGVKLLALVCNGRPVYLARRAFQPSFPPQGDLA